MDLTLMSAADFMEDHKHFLDGWRETFTQTLALVFLGKADGKKNLSEGFTFFVSLNWIMYLLKTDVLGYRQTSWAFGDRARWWKAGKAEGC